MKKLYTLTIAIITCLIFTSTAYAGWTIKANPITGSIKAIAGGIYHTMETPIQVLTFQKSPTKIFDLTRGPVKAVNEFHDGCLGKNTGDVTNNIGTWNKGLESNVITHALRNGVIAGIGTGMTVSAFGVNALHATQTAWWTSIGAGAITAADDYYDKH